MDDKTVDVYFSWVVKYHSFDPEIKFEDDDLHNNWLGIHQCTHENYFHVLANIRF